MKRRVVQHGPSTLIVSLPSDWTKSNKIKKGDEINVEVHQNRLMIFSEMHERESDDESIEVDVTGKKSVIHRLISALYKAGYDKIGIKYESFDELAIIQDIINNELIGYEIVSEKKGYLEAKKISKIDSKEFELMLRRTFLFVIGMGEDSITAMKEKDFLTLKNIVIRDKNINKLTDYCRRSLNTKGTVLFKKRAPPLYFICEEVEKIGDIYRDIALRCSESESIPCQMLIELQEKLNDFLREFYSLLYKFNIDQYEEFISRKKSTEKQLHLCISKCPKKDLPVLMMLYNLLYLIFDMNGSLLATVL